MSGYQSIKLTDWLIDRDPDDDGVARGWVTSVSAAAQKTAAPSIIQQTFPEYHGVAFYWHAFTPDIRKTAPTDRLLLRFDGVDYKAVVWLNGEKLGENEGGEVPFSFDVTDCLRLDGENLLTVRVVNPTDRDIDGLNITNAACRNKTIEKRAGSNLNHGGIWYGVELVCLPAVYLADCFLSGDIHTGELRAQAEIISAAAGGASVTLGVYDKTTGSLIQSAAASLLVAEGRNAAEWTLRVPDPVLWDVDNPHLYRVAVTLETAFGRHTLTQNFGFREFTVRDGYFYLNGKKLFVKSAHSGNAFPVGQMIPVWPAMTKQDFYYAKACGFNMIRSIAGLFRPEQLDFCDEIGLMVYEECLASWLLGCGDCPVGDEDALLRRFDRCTEAMIRRDRNHACVTVWGLLNETTDGPVFRRAAAFLPQARALDPTRLILLNSGRFDNASEIGSVSNPGSLRWEPVWGGEGTRAPGRYADIAVASRSAAGDFHAYPAMPMCDAAVDMILSLGKDEKPVFLSEFGTGALFDVIDEWRHFQQYGFRADLEDASWLKYQSDSLQRDWARFGLTSVYPNAEMMLRESQRLNADARYRDFNVIRANPNLCGFSLTGLLDHGMCGEGLWTYWRRFKPEMFDAVSDGWSPLRFCLFCTPHVYAGDAVRLEAYLANDGVLRPGDYTAEFSITGVGGVVIAFQKTFSVVDDAFAVKIFSEDIVLDAPAGDYAFHAYLTDGGAPAGNRLAFHVTARAAAVPAVKQVGAVGLAEAVRDHLADCGAAVEPVAPEGGVLLVGGRLDAAQLPEILAHADRGGKVVFLSPEPFLSQTADLRALDVAPEIGMVNYRDWLYHKECVMTPHTVFDAFGVGLVDFPRFGQTFPRAAIATPKTPDYIISPAFYTGFSEIKNAYGAYHAICGFRRGRGAVILNCFKLESAIQTEPAAGLLLKGLIDYADSL